MSLLVLAVYFLGGKLGRSIWQGFGSYVLEKSNIGSAGHVSYVPDIWMGGGINAGMDRVFISEGKP